MISNTKTLYKSLSNESKRKAIQTMIKETGRTKGTIKNHWFWNDCVPKELQSKVEKILKKTLNEQEKQNSRKEAV